MVYDTAQNRLAGYEFLISQYGLRVLPNWHRSSVKKNGTLRSGIQDGQVESCYPSAYWPGDRAVDHLEFAIKYDGVNLNILSATFEALEEEEIERWIGSKPTSKYARRIWFLYEFLTGRELHLENLRQGNYVDLLDTNTYYAAMPGRRVQRQRVVNNLLGEREFCPLVRRTKKLAGMEEMDLAKCCEELTNSYPIDLLRRALSYLYNKETKSSFEIEQTKPSASRTEKFIALLQKAQQQDFCEKPLLIKLQNSIVDSRFQDADYRTSQNYVGQSLSHARELVHYVCPKPSDLEELMSGLLASHKIMSKCGLPAIVHAGVISYGFVFIHPFEDGNGRIHRFLVHNILSLRNAIPKGLMFPVSAAILKNPALYDESLEAFSKPLMPLIEYEIDDMGQMSILGETKHLYQYMDMTAQVETLYDFVKLTIEHELVEQLDFLVSYDKTKQSIREIVDMPDGLINLFIQLCLQNKASLSARKRESLFASLSEEECARMEEAVAQGFRKESSLGD